MTKTLNKETYNIFFEDSTLYLENLSEEELIETCNNCMDEWNEECKDEEPIEHVHTMEEVKTFSEGCGWIIRNTKGSEETDYIKTTFERCFNFNTSINVRAERTEYDYEEQGSWVGSIKPLYIKDNEIRLQVQLKKLCPSGIWDNGIQKTMRFKRNITFYSTLDRLIKDQVRCTLGFKSYKVEYVI